MRKFGQASVLSQKEWSKLESVCDVDYHKMIWSLLRYTGARIGEVILLKVKDVYADYDNRLIYDAITYRKENRKGKDKHHVVPICAQLKLLLRGYFQASESEWMFPSPIDPMKPISYEAVLFFLKRKSEEAGLGHLRITTHSGRRSCITELARHGTDLKTIQAVSGHSSLANLARYIETDPERTLNALEGIF
ncbi:site-specific integrase [Aphanothece hegewaldii CCALA 016]|uniref:Site-specific integrase n=1 Tax=Aphanothece hegewaldii CCALA 016 TaxID=2107694 RepID=A0A2T1LT91_9CHRO|nr:tyrosine-type recombinase/integrase [Aphanothece hegewaldii]PSF33638.1 site-specific integrase [Aphanothece hegewaldii CCALA 016]